MNYGETPDPRDKELKELREQGARIPKLEGRIADLERKLQDALMKLDMYSLPRSRTRSMSGEEPPLYC